MSQWLFIFGHIRANPSSVGLSSCSQMLKAATKKIRRLMNGGAEISSSWCVTSQKWPMWFLPHDLYLLGKEADQKYTVTTVVLWKWWFSSWLEWLLPLPGKTWLQYCGQYWKHALFINTNNLYVCSVTQSCSLLCNPMDCSPPDSSVHGLYK